MLLLAIAAAAAVAAGVLIAVGPFGGSGTSSPPSRQLESIFQDDRLLLDSPGPTVGRTLNTLRELGVDRVRVTVLWLAIAPDAGASRPPAHFDATNPRDYPAAGWAAYDRLVQLASARGIALDFNVTAPGPLWAMARPAPALKLATHYVPSAPAFGQFVTAVGRRYSGSWPAAASSHRLLPRVSFWTIWNEPNQPGWLAPQWRGDAGHAVMETPRLYRGYVDAGFSGLARSGHRPANDTILIGELAPEGTESSAAESPIPPLPFLRALYCVDGGYRPLSGPAATELGCPGGSRRAFVRAHPGLFSPSGFAHHPYSFFLAPDAPMSDPNFVPLSDLGRLERSLDAIFAAYGVHRRLPIYLTEYGYETNPPDPFRGVSLRMQARYLSEAQYLAWRDPRVRSMAQFLLEDSAPNPSYPRGSIGYWSTFQTGLDSFGGAPKPALASYRLPIFLARPRVPSGGAVTVWAMLRLAPNGSREQAEILWRAATGPFRALATVTTSERYGFLTARVRPPASGQIQIRWRAADGRTFVSRTVTIRVVRSDG